MVHEVGDDDALRAVEGTDGARDGPVDDAFTPAQPTNRPPLRTRPSRVYGGRSLEWFGGCGGGENLQSDSLTIVGTVRYPSAISSGISTLILARVASRNRGSSAVDLNILPGRVSYVVVTSTALRSTHPSGEVIPRAGTGFFASI